MRTNFIIPLSLLLLVLASACGKVNPPVKVFEPSKLPLDKIALPQGFRIESFAEGIKNARSLELSPNGTLFVGTRGEGKVYALRDEDGDFRADTVYTIAKGLKMPNGVAFRDGHLYVAEVSRILKFENIEDNLANPPEPVVVFDNYPSETHHGWKFIAFGPDGKLYVPVGAPCNICESEDEVFASITRLNPDGTGMEIVQRGIRNTVGFTWHPQTGELWFTDNGRDWMGDNEPACELNHAPRDGMHFGYPYCHEGDLPDPEFGARRSCDEFTPPVQDLGPHVAPLGVEFYTGQQFPEEYRGHLFIAEHGSWNRSEKIGYRVMMVKLDGNEAVSYQPFATGWLDKGNVWGRPVDLEFLPDGSMLVSDDFADAVYRVYYER
ncbi:MAG: sorbosone dehydrogenase family protein [Lewinellaceae bacterium]|nr:sorbosone dehydrogenase family protein [Lewinellaceae bacterium]